MKQFTHSNKYDNDCKPVHRATERFLCGVFEGANYTGDVTCAKDGNGGYMFRIEYRVHYKGYSQTLTLYTFDGAEFERVNEPAIYKTEAANNKLEHRAINSALECLNSTARDTLADQLIGRALGWY